MNLTIQMSLPTDKARQAIRRLKVGECLVVQGDDVNWRRIRKRVTPHKGYTPTMDDLPKDRGVEGVQGLLL